MTTAKIPNRRLRRVIAAVTAVVLLGAGAALIVWTTRPHWRTYTFSADPKTGIAVAIDYPDDWHFAKSFSPAKSFNESMQIQLASEPPKGVIRWWLEKVMHQEIVTNSTPTLSNGGSIEIDVFCGAKYKDMASTEKELGQNTPGVTFKYDHVRHILGPALTATGTIDFMHMGVPIGAKTVPPVMQMTGIVIFPDHPREATRTVISIVGYAPASAYWRTGNTVDGIIRRVHLVRTTNVARNR